MASNNQQQQLGFPRDQSSGIGKDGDVPTRKRGRPPIALTEEVLEWRRLSILRVNASRSRVQDGDVPTRKRGRPPIVVTEEVLERRKLSRQRINASRARSEGPSRPRGRPRGSSRGEVRGLQPQDAASLSSTDATRCYVNIDYAPLHALKEALAKTDNGAKTDLPAPILKQFLTSTGETQVVRCICQAKIVDVLGGNGRYYNCCPTCARSLRDLNGKFYCLSCDEETPSLAQRFRIVVRVEDPSGTTTVTLFNKEAEQLVGIPLHKILEEQAEDRGIPPVVRNIIGKVCAFQLKITPYNIIQGCEEYTVTRVSQIAGDTTGMDKTPAGQRNPSGGP